MARLWQCGWELGSLSTGVEVTTTGGTQSLSTTTFRTGSRALRVNPTNTTGFNRYHVFAANQAIAGWQRVYLNAASLPSATTYILRFLDSSNNAAGSIRLTTAGRLQLMTANGNQIGSDSDILATNTWYRVELGTDATSSGTLEGRLDGASFASGANNAAGSWCRITIGVITTNATTDLAFDDWAVNDASGSAQNSWCGAGGIIHLIPSAAGDSNGWSNTSNAAGSTNNYQLVDDVPPNDTTDLVQTGTLDATDMYNLTDSGIGASDTVNVVAVGLRLRNNTADPTAAVRAQIEKTAAGTIAQGAALVANSTSFATNASAEPRIYSLTTYADPDGAAWTQATLDSAQAGVKLTVANTQRIQISALWASVDYTPSAGGDATASPSVVATTASVPAPAVSTDSATSPALVAAVASIPTPAPSAGSTASPAVVSAVADVPAPTLSASQTASPAAVTAAAGIPAPDISVGSTASPDVVPAAASVPTPSVASGSSETATPDTVPAAVVVPGPDVSAGSAASPSVVAAVAAISAPTVSAGLTVSTSVVLAVADVPIPTTSSGAAALPETVTATASIDAPAVSNGHTITPDTVSAVASIPTPTVQAGGGATVNPDTVQAAAGIPAPTLSTGSAASPSVVAASTSIPAPTSSAGTTASPASLAASASIPDPTPTAGSTASPVTVSASASIPVPTTTAGGNATANASVVQAVASIPSPFAAADSTATPITVLATAAVPTPTTTVLVAATPAAVAAFASIPAALMSSTARPPTVAAVASIPTPTASTTDPAGDITVSVGPPRRGWSAGLPSSRSWMAGAARR